MQIHLLAVGTRMDTWVSQGYQEFAKRLPPECRLKLVEIPAARRTKNSVVTKLMDEEAGRIQAAIPKGAHVVALDQGGKQYSTQQLSRRLSHWLQEASDIALLVGGPDGLAPQCLSQAQEKWSLSQLTLPHPLVRIVVAEQLYRAWSILKNHPYHR